MMSIQSDYAQRFDFLFSPQELLSTFHAKIQYSSTKGVDRINGSQFASRAEEALQCASRKALSGNLYFSPYLEALKTKGRGKPPRLIAIPTVRDRVILNQLKGCLAYLFPDCVPKSIANQYVKTLAEELPKEDPNISYVCGCDIKDFYGSIDPALLMKRIEDRLSHPLTLKLLQRALLTPTIPRNAQRHDYHKYRQDRGIPQGLAISNILAAIYLNDVDIAMFKMNIHYKRYVDDIHMYGSGKEIRCAHRSLMARLRHRNLQLHRLDSGKSYISLLKEPFGYLGYYFKWPHVTVRDSTVERILQSIAAKCSDYSHNKKRRLERLKYLTPDRLKDIFILELNERITGAISENKRYGWIAYFSYINDLSLLHKLDAAVIGIFSRIPDISRESHRELKKFSRSYFEMKFNPKGGYIRNYDNLVGRAEKLGFLVERGRIAPDETLTDQQINTRFESYKRSLLAKMHADEGIMS
jgi:RNA-directed DNA polymerase